MKLMKNIKNLKNLNYTSEEISYINQFINFDLFYTEVPEKNVLTTYNTNKKFTKQQMTESNFTYTNFDNNNTESNAKQMNALKKSKKFEEKRNNVKNAKNTKLDNMEHIMKELNDKDNEINLSIDNSHLINCFYIWRKPSMDTEYSSFNKSSNR